MHCVKAKVNKRKNLLRLHPQFQGTVKYKQL